MKRTSSISFLVLLLGWSRFAFALAEDVSEQEMLLQHNRIASHTQTPPIRRRTRHRRQRVTTPQHRDGTLVQEQQRRQPIVTPEASSTASSATSSFSSNLFSSRGSRSSGGSITGARTSSLEREHEVNGMLRGSGAPPPQREQEDDAMVRVRTPSLPLKVLEEGAMLRGTTSQEQEEENNVDMVMLRMDDEESSSLTLPADTVGGNLRTGEPENSVSALQLPEQADADGGRLRNPSHPQREYERGGMIRAPRSGSSGNGAAPNSSSATGTPGITNTPLVRTTTPSMVHIFHTHLMQGQGDLVHLGRARLDMLRTLAAPSVQQQTDQNYMWFIWTDPHLTEELKTELVDVVEGLDRTLVLAAPEPTSRRRRMEGSTEVEGASTSTFVDRDFRSWILGQDVDPSMVWAGRYQDLEDYHRVAQDTVVLETQLAYADSLSRRFVERVQFQARQSFPITTSTTTMAAASPNDILEEELSWRVWCPDKHMEWRLYQGQNEHVEDITGRLVDVEDAHEHRCASSGLTLGYGVATTRADVPTTSTHQPSLHTVLPLCLEQHANGDDAEGSLVRNCLDNVNMHQEFAVFSLRTAEADDLRTIFSDYDDEENSTTNNPMDSSSITTPSWSLLRESFPASLEDVQGIRERIQANLDNILRDVFLAECGGSPSFCRGRSGRRIPELMHQIIDTERP